MKILHTTPTLDISYGGPTTCTYYLVKGLNELIPTDLLTLASEKIIGHDEFIKALPNDAFSPLLYSKNFGHYLSEHATEYDVIHANVIWYYFSHQARKAAEKANKPFLLSPHGMLYPNALKGKSSWKKRIVMPLFQQDDLERATMLHATCKQEMMHLRNLGYKQPIAVIPNCLNIDSDYLQMSGERREENSRRRFGFVGRVARIKNIDRIIAAWNKLGDKTHDAELVIIGGGDDVYMNELKQYVAENGMRNVTFKGFLTGNALRREVHRLDVQLLVSDSENFGMVVPEALINRVPVIASKGTPWNVLPECNCGWWIDNSIDAIAETIMQGMQLSEEERLTMGENGRELVLDKFSKENVANQMLRVYEYVLGIGPKTDDIYE